MSFLALSGWRRAGIVSCVLEVACGHRDRDGEPCIGTVRVDYTHERATADSPEYEHASYGPCAACGTEDWTAEEEDRMWDALNAERAA